MNELKPYRVFITMRAEYLVKAHSAEEAIEMAEKLDAETLADGADKDYEAEEDDET